ncbi:MAG: hypothetical protein ACSLFP_15765, partial [Acidimicrobiales bacterium]
MRTVRTLLAGALLAAPLTLIVGVSPASAATLGVQQGAADNAGCNDANPYPTISQAIGCAEDGDTVTVGAGTFNERIVINKAISVVGSGVGTTIIDGGGVDDLAGNGGQVYVNTGGSMTLSNMTIQDAGANGGGSRHYSIYLRGDEVNPSTGTHTLTDLEIIGGGAVRPDTGIYCYDNAADVVLSNSTLSEINGNQLLMELCTGEATVTGNHFDNVDGQLGAAMYSMRYSGSASAAPQLVSGNFFDGAGVSYNGSFFGLTETVGQFSNLEISGNEFSGMAIGVGLFNRSTLADGANGQIDDVAITGNTFTGTGASQAVRLTGFVSNVDITSNTITDQLTGIELRPQTAGHVPTGATASGNRIVGNAVGANAQATTSLLAEHNWWGCNDGPGATGCDTVTGDVDADPWLVLSFAPTPPASVTEGETATFGITTFLDSDGNESPVGVPGTPDVTFGAVLGTMTPEVASLAAGSAASTYEAGAVLGADQVTATLDNATITWGFTVVAAVGATPAPTPTTPGAP